jgi:hypothetical protein
MQEGEVRKKEKTEGSKSVELVDDYARVALYGLSPVWRREQQGGTPVHLPTPVQRRESAESEAEQSAVLADIGESLRQDELF